VARRIFPTTCVHMWIAWRVSFQSSYGSGGHGLDSFKDTASERSPVSGIRGTDMYRWIVFIHIASVLGLLLVHPVTVAFHLKQERDDTRIRELLEVSEAASTLRWVFFGLTLVSGVVLGFLGSWWSSAWIWAALAIFVLIGVVMNLYGGRMIDRIADTRDNAEMERLLSRFRPWILAVTGTGGLLVILYLMLFKPSF
jgi:hypothetical protein